MTVHGGVLRLRTRGRGDISDLTEGVVSVVESSGVERGVATVFVTGSTAAVTTMEYEPGGVRDLTEALERLVPAEGSYAPGGLRPPTPASGGTPPGQHHDTNAHAHMRAAIVGPSVSIPIVAGRLVLGTWQQVVLLDFDDRERKRTVTVQVLS